MKKGSSILIGTIVVIITAVMALLIYTGYANRVVGVLFPAISKTSSETGKGVTSETYYIKCQTYISDPNSLIASSGCPDKENIKSVGNCYIDKNNGKATCTVYYNSGDEKTLIIDCVNDKITCG